MIAETQENGVDFSKFDFVVADESSKNRLLELFEVGVKLVFIGPWKLCRGRVV